ncbi:hypothetical protein ACLOJK_005378 [Asimina triloba]
MANSKSEKVNCWVFEPERCSLILCGPREHEILLAFSSCKKSPFFVAVSLYAFGNHQLLLIPARDMPPLSASSTFLGFSVLLISVFSILVGGLLVLFFFIDYFRKRRIEVASIAIPEPSPAAGRKPQKPPPSFSKKSHAKSHSQAAEKDQSKRHHHLDVNTLKGHGDAVNGLCFSSDGRNLATACADGVVRVFKLDDASNKSFKFLRINLPAGCHPSAVAFSEGASSLVVAAQSLYGSSLYMYGEATTRASDETKQQAKAPPEIKWEHHKVHDKRNIITLVGTSATYGTADGTDVILCHGKTGKILGTVDTNQLKNTMATVSPNGRFLAAAAFTADVKIFVAISNVQRLNFIKSAVTWLCFTPDSEKIITASKDGSMRSVTNNTIVLFYDQIDPQINHTLLTSLDCSRLLSNSMKFNLEEALWS